MLTVEQSGSARKRPATGADGQAPTPARAASRAAAADRAPPVATLVVDTIDSAGRSSAARAVAARLNKLGYRIGRVTATGRTDEPDTAVYFEPGGGAAATRLARTLGLPSRPLPGGTNPRRLVLVIGRQGLDAR